MQTQDLPMCASQAMLQTGVCKQGRVVLGCCMQVLRLWEILWADDWLSSYPEYLTSQRAHTDPSSCPSTHTLTPRASQPHTPRTDPSHPHSPAGSTQPHTPGPAADALQGEQTSSAFASAFQFQVSAGDFPSQSGHTVTGAPDSSRAADSAQPSRERTSLNGGKILTLPSWVKQWGGKGGAEDGSAQVGGVGMGGVATPPTPRTPKTPLAAAAAPAGAAGRWFARLGSKLSGGGDAAGAAVTARESGENCSVGEATAEQAGEAADGAVSGCAATEPSNTPATPSTPLAPAAASGKDGPSLVPGWLTRLGSRLPGTGAVSDPGAAAPGTSTDTITTAATEAPSTDPAAATNAAEPAAPAAPVGLMARLGALRASLKGSTGDAAGVGGAVSVGADASTVTATPEASETGPDTTLPSVSSAAGDSLSQRLPSTAQEVSLCLEGVVTLLAPQPAHTDAAVAQSAGNANAADGTGSPQQPSQEQGRAVTVSLAVQTDGSITLSLAAVAFGASSSSALAWGQAVGGPIEATAEGSFTVGLANVTDSLLKGPQAVAQGARTLFSGLAGLFNSNKTDLAPATGPQGTPDTVQLHVSLNDDGHVIAQITLLPLADVSVDVDRGSQSQGPLLAARVLQQGGDSGSKGEPESDGAGGSKGLLGSFASRVFKSMASAAPASGAADRDTVQVELAGLAGEVAREPPATAPTIAKGGVAGVRDHTASITSSPQLTARYDSQATAQSFEDTQTVRQSDLSSSTTHQTNDQVTESNAPTVATGAAGHGAVVSTANYQPGRAQLGLFLYFVAAVVCSMRGRVLRPECVDGDDVVHVFNGLAATKVDLQGCMQAAREYRVRRVQRGLSPALV